MGCAVGWPAAAVLVLFECHGGLYLAERLPDVVGPGAEPYLVENWREAAVMMVVVGVLLVLMLALAVYCTVKLRKRGRNCEHPAPDKW